MGVTPLATPPAAHPAPPRAAAGPATPSGGDPAPWVPRPGAWRGAVRALVRALVIFPLLRLLAGRVRVSGAQGLPAGPLVLAANHASHTDTAVILRALPRRMRGRLAPAAAADYFFAGPMRSALTAALLGGFPFPRRGDAGLERAAAELAAGRVVLLFPEGTRDGGPFRAGVGRLAAAGATVVPVGLAGTAGLLPKGARLPRRARTAVVFGEARRCPPDADPAAVAAQLQACVGHLAAAAAAAADPVAAVAAGTVRGTGGALAAQREAAAPAGTDASARPPARRTLYTRARTLATSRRGLAVVLGWSFAEALVFPVIPDLGIGLLAAAAPSRLGPLALAGAAGSVAGGLVAYALGGAGLVPPLPLVTPGMAETARGLLADGGAAGVWTQPLSPVPYKAFAFQAAAQGAALGPFLAVTALARGARMLAVAALMGGLGGALRRWCPPRRVPGVYATAVICLLVLFTLGLVEVVARS